MPSKTTIELAAAKLAESGLSLDDAKELGLTFHDNLAELDKVFMPVPGIRFEYRDITGEPMESRPGWGPVWRCRQLAPAPEERTGFDAQTTGEPLQKKSKKKDNRYKQPFGSISAPYFPSLMMSPLIRRYWDGETGRDSVVAWSDAEEVGWPDIAIDTDWPIILTEGEFKAAKMCKEGFPCIGLGGVWNFKSENNNYVFLPDLKKIDWRRRHVYVIYDSDMQANANMTASVNEVASQLFKLGAFVHCGVFLPALDGEDKKTGLDDFLVHPNGGAADLVSRIIVNQEPWELAGPLWDWNDKYIHITLRPHCLVSRKDGETYKVDDWKAAHQTLDLYRKVLDKDGNATLQETSLGNEIFKWPMHSQLERIVYEPSLPALSVIHEHHILDHKRDETIRSAFNLWPGWGVEPVKGDIGMALELIDHLFGNDTQEAKWFLAWLAYQVQHPGVKLSTAILLIGKPGCGKSMLAQRVMSRIFGKNYAAVEGQDFFSQFNEWANKRQFVLADECFVKGDKDNKAHGAQLRNYITRDFVMINEKYGLKYSIQDCCNIYMTSNHLDGIPVLRDERRYFIYKTVAERLSAEFKRRWDKWKLDGGIEAFFYYLLHEVDTAWFDPHGEAPETRGFHDVQDSLRTDAEETARDVVTNGLPIGQMRNMNDLWDVNKLFRLLDEDVQRRIRSPKFFRDALEGNGAVKLRGSLHDGRSKIGGEVFNLYALRNTEKWMKASYEERAKYYTAHQPDIKQEKF